MLHRSDQNKSRHPRRSMICTYNAAQRSLPESQHPRYTPLVKVPDAKIREFGLQRLPTASAKVWLAAERDRDQHRAAPEEIGGSMPRRHLTAFIALGLTLPPALLAQTAYYRHVISTTARRPPYWNSSAQAGRPARWKRKSAPACRAKKLSVTSPCTGWLLAARPGRWLDAEIHLVNFPTAIPTESETLILGDAPQASPPPTCPSWCRPSARLDCRWRSSRSLP
jgi:hypothetical protein